MAKQIYVEIIYSSSSLYKTTGFIHFAPSPPPPSYYLWCGCDGSSTILEHTSESWISGMEERKAGRSLYPSTPGVKSYHSALGSYLLTFTQETNTPPRHMEAGFTWGSCYCRLRVTCANKGGGGSFMGIQRDSKFLLLENKLPTFTQSLPPTFYFSHYLLSTPFSPLLQGWVWFTASETSWWSYLCFFDSPQAHFTQTGEELKQRWAQGSSFLQRSWQFCRLFMRQAGLDKFGWRTRALKQLSWSVHFTRQEENLMKREPS